MLLTGISLLGWVHSFACVMAIFTGAYVLAGRKGTPRHRLWGWWYAAAMVVQSLLVMAIYRFDFIPGPHAKPARTSSASFIGDRCWRWPLSHWPCSARRANSVTWPGRMSMPSPCSSAITCWSPR
ncbi:MAG: hypothetical protein H0U98_00425 [Alphaproteobacteria bacterium]|nr:hypothetical protein [Alphaproteobacteria bacterium]